MWLLLWDFIKRRAAWLAGSTIMLFFVYGDYVGETTHDAPSMALYAIAWWLMAYTSIADIERGWSSTVGSLPLSRRQVLMVLWIQLVVLFPLLNVLVATAVLLPHVLAGQASPLDFALCCLVGVALAGSMFSVVRDMAAWAGSRHVRRRYPSPVRGDDTWLLVGIATAAVLLWRWPVVSERLDVLGGVALFLGLALATLSFHHRRRLVDQMCLPRPDAAAPRGRNYEDPPPHRKICDSFDPQVQMALGRLVGSMVLSILLVANGTKVDPAALLFALGVMWLVTTTLMMGSVPPTLRAWRSFPMSSFQLWLRVVGVQSSLQLGILPGVFLVLVFAYGNPLPLAFALLCCGIGLTFVVVALSIVATPPLAVLVTIGVCSLPASVLFCGLFGPFGPEQLQWPLALTGLVLAWIFA